MSKEPVFVALATVLMALAGCSKKNEFQPPPAPGVTTARPEVKEVTIYTGFPGRLEASEHVEIRARVKGFLQSIHFEDGQRVKKGDLLFTIEPEEYQAAVNSAEANVAQATANRQLAEATLKRTEQAYETKAVAEVEVLTARAQMQAAVAQVQAAEAALQKAQLDLSYTEIKAPMDGRVARRALSVGNLVGDGGSSQLTVLVQEAPINVFFNVDERAMIPYLLKGTRQTPDPSKIPPVKIELANGFVLEELGTVNYLDPSFDPETGTAQARALFQNRELTLMPGLYGKILVPETLKEALLVPDLAVQQDMGGAYVLAVNKDKIVEQIYLKKGPLVGMQRVVEKDPTKDRQLTAADQIIINGLQRARPGMPVTPTEATAATASTDAK
jgi:RND family efflux transporter MFP subunit